jgi:RNA polymerase sigma-70 factor (ECF subfamily)
MSTPATTVAPTDEQLMQSVAEGHPDAVRVLYDRYNRQVYSLARRICAEDGLAEDTTQEVFLALWRDPAKFDKTRRFSTWLLAVTHHKAVDRVRRETTATKRNISATDDDIERRSPAGPAVDETALNLVEGNHVRAALRKLPTEQRRALALAYYGGFTQREVATITGVPLGTVKSRIHTGTQLLRRLLTPLMPELAAVTARAATYA